MSHLVKFRTHVSAIALTSTALLGSCLAGNSFALVLDNMPSYSISPSLNGLNIAYFAKQDKIKITLYLVNHERFPVLCDAEYTGGPDKVDSSEQIVLPEKAIAFTFSYPQVTDNVIVQLMCVKAKTQSNTDTATNATATTPETVVLDGNPGDAVKSDTVQVPETDLSVKY